MPSMAMEPSIFTIESDCEFRQDVGNAGAGVEDQQTMWRKLWQQNEIRICSEGGPQLVADNLRSEVLVWTNVTTISRKHVKGFDTNFNFASRATIQAE